MKVKPRVKPKTFMSETIKVVCYRSKTLKNGTHPLMLRVCKDSRKKYQSIGTSIHSKHWDFKNNEPNDLCPNKDGIQLLINQKIIEVQRSVLNKRIEGKDFTASSLLSNQTFSTKLHNNVDECFKYYISDLKEQKRYRYAGMYEISYNSFIKCMGSLNIPFNDIDIIFIVIIGCSSQNFRGQATIYSHKSIKFANVFSS